MGGVQHNLWVPGVLFLLGGLIQWGGAIVLVEFQPGPLYRVIGHPLSISCNVSGFSNPLAQQDFQLSIYKPNKPGLEIQIISTIDKDISMGGYGRRVRAGEISVERLSVTSVLFKVMSLEEGDEGEYECHTPNSETIYLGTYHARTTVNVIEDTLTATSNDPPSLSLSEGDTITLQCLASSNTYQHTHLSVTWYFHGDGEASPHPIIVLNQYLIVTPGLGFEHRYQAGLIGLDKVEDVTYRLRMSRIEMSDVGRIYCQAQEWIQDPDRSWYAINQKNAPATTLKIKAIEVAPDTGSMRVHMTVDKAQLQEGEELSVRCTVDARGMAGQFFSVAWIKDNQELAKIGPTGVLSVGPEYEGQQRRGELRAVRLDEEKTHLLTLKPIRIQDQGVFHCRAWSHESGGNGVFTQGPSQDSPTEPITIKATESGLAVAMETVMVNISEGGELRLTCKVSGVMGQLSVTWQHRAVSTATSPFTDVIGLSRVGVLEVGAEFKQRKVGALRPAVDTFILALSDVTSSDAGTYQCIVSEWTTETDGNAKKEHSQSQAGHVEILPVESLVTVDLRSRDAQVVEGGEAELVCRVRGPIPVNVRWSLKREGESAPEDILALSNTGDITWRGDPGNYQLSVTTSPNQVLHKLRVVKASRREAGQYRCEISAFMQGRYRKPQSSNQLAVSIQTPVSDFSVDNIDKKLVVKEGNEVELTCTLTTVADPASVYALTWFYTKPSSSSSPRVPLVILGHDGILKYPEDQENQGLRGRLIFSRPTQRTFQLGLQRAHQGDSGAYQCQVDQYKLSNGGNWERTASAQSGTTDLTVKPRESLLTLSSSPSLLDQSLNTDIQMECSIVRATSESSRFAVTWLSQKGERNETILSSDSDAVVTPRAGLSTDQRISIRRLKGQSFELTIRQARISDSGMYFCVVEEWLQHPLGHWYKLMSSSAAIKLSLKDTVSDLSVNMTDLVIEGQEGKEVQLNCSLNSDDPASLYGLTWFYTKPGSSSSPRVPLVILSHDGILNYPEDQENHRQQGLRGRLIFSRPTQRTFQLGLQRAHQGDSGAYQCQVDQYKLSDDGNWEQTASAQSGTTNLTVQGLTESSHEDRCMPVLGFLMLLVCFLAILIIALSIKLKGRGSAGKKKQPTSLWAEVKDVEVELRGNEFKEKISSGGEDE